MNTVRANRMYPDRKQGYSKAGMLSQEVTLAEGLEATEREEACAHDITLLSSQQTWRCSISLCPDIQGCKVHSPGYDISAATRLDLAPLQQVKLLFGSSAMFL